LWIKNHKPSIQLSGIGVDANPLMVARAEQHWRLNGLALVAMQGLVGEPARRFSINSNHVASSCVSRESTPGMEVASLNVWALDIEKIWDSEVKWLGDLMKVDIEGSELGLFSKTKIASRFKRIVVEWHEPLCSLPMLRYLLTDHKLDKFSTHGDIGYAYFSRI
jgi:transposase InsO family protein